MGYYMTVERIDLKTNGLTKLSEDLEESCWRIEDDHVLLKETYFKWDDWFNDELKKLATAGVTGEIELSGEQAEWEKYVLKNGMVEAYTGSVTYPEEPEKTW